MAVSESPEPEPEEEELPDTRKRRRTKKMDQYEADLNTMPSGKRRKLDPPSTPDRDEIRSDPIVNVTPGDPTGRNLDEAVPRTHRANQAESTKRDKNDTTSAHGSKASSSGAQAKGSPTAWLRKFKEMVMLIPNFTWRPKDQQEVHNTYKEVLEKLLDNSSREDQ